jgi:hypothetical protein
MEEDKKELSMKELVQIQSQKKIEKKMAALERKEERETSGNRNKLIIERDATGLYYCRYSLSGRVPDALMGKFTRRQQILDVVALKQIPMEE